MAKDSGFPIAKNLLLFDNKAIKSIYETAGVFNNFFYKRRRCAKIKLFFIYKSTVPGMADA